MHRWQKLLVNSLTYGLLSSTIGLDGIASHLPMSFVSVSALGGCRPGSTALREEPALSIEVSPWWPRALWVSLRELALS